MKSLLSLIFIILSSFSFSQNNSGIYVTSNFNDAYLGFGGKVALKNFNFFVELKTGGGFPAQDRAGINGWDSEEVIEDYRIYTYGVSEYGSYAYTGTTITERVDMVYSNRVLNVGVSKTLISLNKCDIELGLGLGAGVRTNHEVHEYQTQTSEVYHLVLIDYYDRTYDYDYRYEVLRTKNVVYNFTTSLVFSWDKISTGISYDTNFSGVSFSLGFNF